MTKNLSISWVNAYIHNYELFGLADYAFTVSGKLKMAGLFMEITQPWRKAFHSVVSQVRTYIQNYEWFGPAVLKITRSQCLEKVKNACHFWEYYWTVTTIFLFRSQAGKCLDIQNNDWFGPAVLEITRLQGLEKFKMAAIVMKITEPWQKPFYFVVRQVSA